MKVTVINKLKGDTIMIRTAVIGLGMGLNYHVPKIISHPHFELIAVSDVDQKKLERTRYNYSEEWNND